MRKPTDHEKMAYEYAKRQQGFEGSFQEWLNLPEKERELYEAGARGEGTV